MELQERFDESVERIPFHACTEWIAGRSSNGYGTMRIAGKSIHAHRLAWELANGPIPAGMAVLHRCDNRGCVRLSHLFLGSLGDNNRDMAKKGRSDRPAALKASRLREARAMLAAGHKQTEIASRLCVGQSTISRVKRRVGLTYAEED